MRSKHTGLFYFPTCTGELIYIPFHWCVCDAFGVPQPDDWPGIGPQPFVVSSSDFFFFLFIILLLSGGTRNNDKKSFKLQTLQSQSFMDLKVKQFWEILENSPDLTGE